MGFHPYVPGHPEATQEKATRVLYDGKTFEEWRSLWTNELKTEKRTEAIQALAAFARAGYAVESAKAILEVASQYDFRKMGDAERKLLSAVAGALSRSIPVKVWLPMLSERYHTDPETWAEIVIRVLPDIIDAAMRPGQIELLKTIAMSDQRRHRRAALITLVQLDPGLQNKNVSDAVLTHLRSSQTDHQTLAIHALINARKMPPELVQLSLKGPEEIKKLVRSLFNRRGDSAATRALCIEMVDALRSPAHTKNTLDIIRNIAAIGHDVGDAREELKKLLQHEDPRLQVAAAVAISRISGGVTPVIPSLYNKVLSDEGEPLSETELQQRVSAEVNTI